MNFEKRIERIFKLAELELPAFLEAHRDELGDKIGIHIDIEPIHTPPGFMAKDKMIGLIPYGKRAEKQGFAREKNFRQKSRMKKYPNECCSFESERVVGKKFGGGIKARDFFASGSNFPPHLDQKFLTHVFSLADEIDYHQCQKIMDASFLKRLKWEKDVMFYGLGINRPGYDGTENFVWGICTVKKGSKRMEEDIEKISGEKPAGYEFFKKIEPLLPTDWEKRIYYPGQGPEHTIFMMKLLEFSNINKPRLKEILQKQFPLANKILEIW
jgi:hypothetical protein